MSLPIFASSTFPLDMIKTIELFAGVGGFRVGLERVNKKLEKQAYGVVWSNQWEPSTTTQHASRIYENKFGSGNHSNVSIEDVDVKDIPDHDMLVGGFPCQDYSVATTLKNSKGLLGKKGVLWWSIHRILNEKKKKPKYLFLENVDRLLKSPSNQRGRDFAVMLKGLDELGYAVEWRVVNAADYGFPQRRRRIFFLGFHKTSDLYKRMKKASAEEWIREEGIMAKSFPVDSDLKFAQPFDIKGDLKEVSDDFGKGMKVSPFLNSGIMFDGHIYTAKAIPSYEGEKAALRSVLVNESEVPEEYFIDEADRDKWTYLKGAKKEIRKSSTGFEYNYSEGGMVFPDPLDEPSRTIITGEGGKSPSRFKHVITTKKGLRRLLPIELERLNMFPDNHTELEGVADAKRAFLMGNALVVGIIERVAEVLAEEIDR
ncbi:DNA (cytosine-5-)-methyltransferase [Flavobacterium sp. MAH-1]|uniref:Cytosine-specific methyltransferase n=1 Tax=Flavobacterium agri TaxID=2743471 RepID=A0A7Y8Y1T3_9FLAO|nr:DNA (cytosine-5-)-methyltransferase [Flavobacterium agri]NUY80263.1 DNA (cytosine-5-)-methyltransferase [Flavobacterium agri]NYA70288.1 DNA (cytosine-5-)-methyltransferase [Flavobacterium agri]